MSTFEVAETRELKERVIEINRVAKVVKGGRRFSFTALVVIGDEVDRVGVGYGKAREVPLAISKAVDDARKNLFTVPRHGTTITHRIQGEFDAAKVVLRPASEGTGVIAGGGVRAVLELAGIRDVLAKSLGTTNPINMAKATVDGLRKLRRPEDVARQRGKTISEVLPVSRAKVAAVQAAVVAASHAAEAETVAETLAETVVEIAADAQPAALTAAIPAAETPAAEPSAPAPAKDAPAEGHDHAVGELEHVDEQMRGLLQAEGIATTSDLLERGARPAGRKALAKALSVDVKEILRWVNHADLMRIKGIGREFADLLEEAGVDSVPELAQRNAANLATAAATLNEEKRLTGRTPSEKEITDWVDQAKELGRAVFHEDEKKGAS